MKKSKITLDTKPFIKWAGGKKQLLKTFHDYYPSELGKSITKYCEPMVGGGAVLFDIINNYPIKEIIVSDNNFELINAFTVLKNNPEGLIQILQQFEKEHLLNNIENRKKYYYTQRATYNALIKVDNVNTTLKAALFIYLNKTCFNGLYRVNRNGDFNVPMGSYENPKICDIPNLILVSKKLQNVEIISGDYTATENFIDENTFVYIDPPYDNTFAGYTASGFDINDQINLKKYYDKLTTKKAKVMLSNSATDFIKKEYSKYNISMIKSNRVINSNGNKRGKVDEVIIRNYT